MWGWAPTTPERRPDIAAAPLPPPLPPQPKLLTGESVRDALYYCGPVGFSQLSAYLEGRGYEVNGLALQSLMDPLIQSGRVIAKSIPFGGTMIPLFAPRGHGL